MKYQWQNQAVPAKTAELAKKVFKKGNRYLKIRDELGIVFTNEKFKHLFSHQGRAAEAPGNLAIILVMQHLEGLSDREAAEQVGARIDWKYMLGLELEDEGIRHQILTEFRERLIKGESTDLLLDEILQCFREKGWLKEKKKQRTDATYIVSAGRRLKRIELVWEALSKALEVCAIQAPRWLEKQIDERWVRQYARPLGWRELPNKEEEREKYGQQIGEDGCYLWHCLLNSPFYEEWSDKPEIEAWRRIWVQQYYQQDGQVFWRETSESPPVADRISTPYDLDARYSDKKGRGGHVGYQIHLTETVTTQKQLSVVTDVTTRPTSTTDNQVLPLIQRKLVARELTPETHLTDAGYVDAPNLVQSREEFGIDLFGPASTDSSWQKKQAQGYDLAHFKIDWEQRQVICPENQLSSSWHDRVSTRGQPIVQVKMPSRICKPCAARALCTQASVRTIVFRQQTEYEALATARARQETAEFGQLYAARSGVEGLVSQALAISTRRSRYMGLPKTHLQAVLTAVAINLHRAAQWLLSGHRSRTRRSPLLALNVT